MPLDPHSFMATMEKRVCLTSEDKTLLKENADWGKGIASEMADRFYTYLGNDPEMDGIMKAKEGRMHRLRETFVQWFYEMFTGMDNWGDGYADRRWRIGLVHVQIGIGPQHVVPAMATVITASRLLIILRSVSRYGPSCIEVVLMAVQVGTYRSLTIPATMRLTTCWIIFLRRRVLHRSGIYLPIQAGTAATTAPTGQQLPLLFWILFVKLLM